MIDTNTKTSNTLNIDKFCEALGRVLSLQYGCKITATAVKKTDEELRAEGILPEEETDN